MALRNYWVCSDLHQGVEGSPANDATPGWAEKWAALPKPKLMLGDMAEALQFGWAVPDWVRTDVYGNHDPRPFWRARHPSWPILPARELIIGNTLWLHGNALDSWLLRAAGPPVTALTAIAEHAWPDVDIVVPAALQRVFRAGRHGNAMRYARKAAALARERGCEQVVFGHLHQLLDIWIDGVHVVCIGCCCNGRLDFIKVAVRVP